MPRCIQGIVDVGGGHTNYKVINIYNLRQLSVNKWTCTCGFYFLDSKSGNDVDKWKRDFLPDMEADI